MAATARKHFCKAGCLCAKAPVNLHADMTTQQRAPKGKQVTLGETIRDTRETRGLKREDLASQSGVGYWKIVRLENDNRAGRWKDIVAIARVLELDLQQLSTTTPGLLAYAS